MTVLGWRRGGRAGGRPVVLLHGWARDGASDFEATGFAAALGGAGLEVLAPDLPGHCLSSAVLVPPGAEPAAWTAGVLRQDLESMRIRAAGVVGAAEGALVAAHLAVRHPDALRPLVLLSRDDRVGMTGGGKLVALLRGDRGGVFDAEAVETATVATASGAHHHPTLADWAERGAWPAAPRLGALRTPVLLAVGTGDEHRHRAPRLARLFHDARLVTVPGDDRTMLAAPELHHAVAAFLGEHEE